MGRICKPPVLAYSAHGLAQCASSANNQERPRRKRSLERAFIPWVKSFRSPPPSRSVKQRMIEAAIPCQSRRRTRHQCRSRLHAARRSEERRVGNGCASTCLSWWMPFHEKKKIKKE